MTNNQIKLHKMSSVELLALLTPAKGTKVAFTAAEIGHAIAFVSKAEADELFNKAVEAKLNEDAKKEAAEESLYFSNEVRVKATSSVEQANRAFAVAEQTMTDAGAELTAIDAHARATITVRTKLIGKKSLSALERILAKNS